MDKKPHVVLSELVKEFGDRTRTLVIEMRDIDPYEFLTMPGQEVNPVIWANGKARTRRKHYSAGPAWDGESEHRQFILNASLIEHDLDGSGWKVGEQPSPLPEPALPAHTD